MNGLCLITFQPHPVWCSFLNSFFNYKIFIIVDDNQFDCTFFKNRYTNITFVQIENDTCFQHGYRNMNFVIQKDISGWDKAMFGFALGLYASLHFVWFIEDDVYFYDENTIQQIDQKYIHEDLLSSGYRINIDGNKEYWHWSIINIQFPPPYYNAMMCAVRLSQAMMNGIHYYATIVHTLFFLEALFPTLAFKNNLNVQTPHELNTIVYRAHYEKSDINTVNLYHPVKNMEKHIEFRDRE
jgi:hypothetical protein